MSNANPNRLGQIEGAGDELALFLKTFGGEVLTAFEDENVTQGRVMERNISSGKSAQFPATGKIGASYHTPGTEILGQNVAHNEVILTIDGVLLSDVFVSEIDELMNHYEVRSIYSTEMGRELGRQYDENNLRSIVLAARSSAIVTGQSGGTGLVDANFETDGAALAQGLWDAAQSMDEKNVPSERYSAFRPAQYYHLAAQKDYMNQDWGGRGSFANADLPLVAGIRILRNNHVPDANDSANGALPAKYQADYSNVMGVAWSPQAAGVVKLKDMATEAQWDIRRQGHLMVAKYAVGHGPVRSDHAVEFTTI